MGRVYCRYGVFAEGLHQCETEIRILKINAFLFDKHFVIRRRVAGEQTQLQPALALKRPVTGPIGAADFSQQRHHVPFKFRGSALAFGRPTLSHVGRIVTGRIVAVCGKHRHLKKHGQTESKGDALRHRSLLMSFAIARTAKASGDGDGKVAQAGLAGSRSE